MLRRWDADARALQLAVHVPWQQLLLRPASAFVGVSDSADGAHTHIQPDPTAGRPRGARGVVRRANHDAGRCAVSESGDRQISRSSLLRAPRDPHTLTLGAAALAQRRGVVPGPRLCAGGERSIRAILTFYILHSAARPSSRAGMQTQCPAVLRRATCDLWILGRALTSSSHHLVSITARGGHI